MGSGRRVRKARREDFSQIKSLYSNCRDWLESMQIDQWSHGYPQDEIIYKDLVQGSLYALFRAEVILGVVVINEEMDTQYSDIEWRSGSFKCIHRLAVDPKSAGKGIGRKLMGFCEDYCRSKDIKSIRLDTYSLNTKNLNFYEKLGYQKRNGELFYDPLKAPFIPFEIML